MNEIVEHGGHTLARVSRCGRCDGSGKDGLSGHADGDVLEPRQTLREEGRHHGHGQG